MPRPAFSGQYQCGVIVLNDTDFPINMDEVLEIAYEYEATTPDNESEDGSGTLYCVRFPGRPDEVYTENALRRSLASCNKQAKKVAEH